MNFERMERRLTSEVSLNCQIRTVPSQEEVAAKVSNGSKSTLNMGPACPLIVTSRDIASVIFSIGSLAFSGLQSSLLPIDMQMLFLSNFRRSCFLTLRFTCSRAGPIQTAIREKLTTLFKPIYLDIVNESHHHVSNHNQESHFRISIVSKDFESIGDVMHEFDAGLHAISILAKAPSEEMRENKPVPCIGKSKEINLD
ncbi:hypothetical protein TcWFU_000301 [Taenia crassiceps]|uniref:Uncharacterized protein n=1 Tax=Taenia crassiceps TaxID=6207 RepID=A0ABR4QEX6_9CEST